jgi:hypothetical protein
MNSQRTPGGGYPALRETPAQAWARCRPWVEAALAHAGGGYTIEDVQAGIERGDFQFWPGARCAVVTELVVSPRSAWLNFWLTGGELSELLIMRPHIERWALARGCSEARGGGLAERRGWARVLRAAGYRPRWTIYSKNLTQIGDTP